MSALILPSLLGITFLILPGLATCLAAGFRAFTALALAAPLTILIAVTTSVWIRPLGLRWGILPILATTAVAAAIAYAVGRNRTAHVNAERWGDKAAASSYAAVAVAGVLITVQLLRILGTPDAFSQNFDNIFHVNVIRYIVESGNATPFMARDLANPDSATAIYPTAWHALAAFISSWAGPHTVMLGQNALIVSISAVVWPLSVVYLVRTLTTGRALTLMVAGILTASYAVFPIMLLEHGPIYPYLLGIAILPVPLAVLLQILKLAPPQASLTLTVPVLAASSLAVLVAHPSAFSALLPISLSLVWAWAWRARGLGRPSSLRYLAATLAITAAGLVVWTLLRPPPWEWQAYHDVTTAVGQFLTGGAFGWRGSWVLAILTLAGFAVMARTGRLASWALPTFIVLVLWVASSSWPDGPWRDWLSGSFYRDPRRLSALIPLALIPVIAGGFETVSERLSAIRFPKLGLRLAAISALTALAALTQFGPQMTNAVATTASGYRVTPNSLTVNSDEYQLLLKMRDLPLKDAVVLVHKFTGSTFAYALAGVKVTEFQIFELPSPAESYLREHLSTGMGDPKVCEALKTSKVTHVLDFGSKGVTGEAPVMKGLLNLENSPMVRLALQVGSARLYQVVGCH